ncbi:RNA-binding protein [Amycolatopsis sp. WAC 04182]|uniref:RNA-binding protein n=1 Tax=Amycolatopsis sp. WAC 04182 TaxID=2203198 RepID=UPI000F790C86|nr:RNA-binding protein [Amycolatopsis sp. WAC 04182]RSN60811.1 RNA-binding protein [Amycolatopsis sp. WAC 04182]
MSTSYVHRITKYDPADRDEWGTYRGSEHVSSDHGPVEAAYLAAVTAFAEDTGVTHLDIRDPEVTGFVHFGVEPPIDGHGLHGLFPADLTGYHDGAQITLNVGRELVRAMLRENGAWCRLEVEDRFFVHVGYDQYMFIGSDQPCGHAIALTTASGLFVEPLDGSPYEPDDEEPYESRPADAAFWAEVATLVAQRGSVLLEEQVVGNHSRWHRLTTDGVPELGPRALLNVWPDLSTDIPAVLRTMSPDFTGWAVLEHADGRIHGFYADSDDRAGLAEAFAGARAAILLPLTTADRNPLLVAVRPDDDGVVRARWPS